MDGPVLTATGVRTTSAPSVYIATVQIRLRGQTTIFSRLYMDETGFYFYRDTPCDDPDTCTRALRDLMNEYLLLSSSHRSSCAMKPR